MRGEIYLSPAKLNLFFRVLRRRDDGYHEIASLYQAIAFGDNLILRPHSVDLFTCSDPELPCDATNLVVKALKLFRTHYSFPSVHLYLEKRIPKEAGLGGGSSNAATTLWALNQFANRPASVSKLQEMAATIGSDVPFFFSTGSAYCTGRGEIIRSINLPNMSFSIAKPPFGLSTQAVYRQVNVDEIEPIDPLVLLESFREGKPILRNDLEPFAMRLEPRLAAFKQSLKDPCAMTGSGTAFFRLTDEIAAYPSCIRAADSWFSLAER